MKTRSLLAILTTSLLVVWCASPATPDTTTQTGTEVTVTAQEASTPEQTETLPTYTLADVATHNDESSCRTIVNNNVYDLTSFINQHPGWAKWILRMCGTDGTTWFMATHGGKTKPEETLAWLQIGTLSQ